LAIALNISDRVIWHGWLDNPWDEIHEATALVLTSDYEGLPMVIGEAMTRGVPVISTDCPTGPADYIEQGVNGWLIPTGDQSMLLEALRQVIHLSEHTWKQFSAAAVQQMGLYAGESVYQRMIRTVDNFVQSGDLT
jgi:UDP-D-galactose:(glucosyl)LPS alpha-1,6-D-galactosyltransferase